MRADNGGHGVASPFGNLGNNLTGCSHTASGALGHFVQIQGCRDEVQSQKTNTEVAKLKLQMSPLLHKLSV